jgi:glutamyl-Q tRNA(Asp) synthetase
MRPAGRFAPSPTGPLHFGSLLAALASFLDARARDADWLLRIDDLDIYRTVEGSEAAILKSLEAHGLPWDGSIIRQTERLPLYESALERLSAEGHTFFCTCSRTMLKGLATYPGTCRGITGHVDDASIRLRVPDRDLSFQDLIAGEVTENLSHTSGDFIIRRRDGLIAYQLATAVDDGDPQIAHVVRGSDLLENTIRQIYLMELLELMPPTYAHIPTLVTPDGKKLSKQNHAPGLDDDRAAENLTTVMAYLGLRPPADADRWTPAEIVAWGVANWRLEDVPTGDCIFRH